MRISHRGESLGTLTVLYTAHLCGDEKTLTELLPRLHTFIQQLKQEHGHFMK